MDLSIFFLLQTFVILEVADFRVRSDQFDQLKMSGQVGFGSGRVRVDGYRHFLRVESGSGRVGFGSGSG